MAHVKGIPFPYDMKRDVLIGRLYRTNTPPNSSDMTGLER